MITSARSKTPVHENVVHRAPLSRQELSFLHVGRKSLIQSLVMTPPAVTDLAGAGKAREISQSRWLWQDGRKYFLGNYTSTSSHCEMEQKYFIWKLCPISRTLDRLLWPLPRFYTFWQILPCSMFQSCNKSIDITITKENWELIESHFTKLPSYFSKDAKIELILLSKNKTKFFLKTSCIGME